MGSDIVVVGGGIAGIGSAMALAKKSYPVTLIEKNFLGSGSSSKNPGRLSLGFHYTDDNFAQKCLRESILIKRQYPKFVRNPSNQNGTYYFITEDSTTPYHKILKHYDRIKRAYQKLCELDPHNQVFGPIDSFYRILHPKEYQDFVNNDRVKIAITTKETFLDWIKLIQYFKKNIIKNPLITLYEQAEVTKISQVSSRFKIEFSNNSYFNFKEKKILYSKAVVNCTGYHIDQLNQNLIAHYPFRTLRLKAVITVELPLQLRDLPSMFFCMGSHCTFTQLGPGLAMITYAPVTNIELCDSLVLSEHAENLLNGRVSESEKEAIGNRILQGASQYIPELTKATLKSTQFGVVRSHSEVYEAMTGLINNSATKLFFFLENSKRVLNLISTYKFSQ